MAALSALQPGSARHVRTHLLDPPRDAALAGGARDRARRVPRGRRQAAVWRPAVRRASRAARCRSSAAGSPMPTARGARVTPPPATATAEPLAPPLHRRPCRTSARCSGSAPRARVRGRLALLGPAFAAAIAYVDPGNFATNITAGATYATCWCGCSSSRTRWRCSSSTGRRRPGSPPVRASPSWRAAFRRQVTRGLWVQAEIIAIATDLAEVLGGAMALHLLFGVPPLAAA